MQKKSRTSSCSNRGLIVDQSQSCLRRILANISYTCYVSSSNSSSCEPSISHVSSLSKCIHKHHNIKIFRMHNLPINQHQRDQYPEPTRVRNKKWEEDGGYRQLYQDLPEAHAPSGEQSSICPQRLAIRQWIHLFIDNTKQIYTATNDVMSVSSASSNKPAKENMVRHMVFRERLDEGYSSMSLRDRLLLCFLLLCSLLPSKQSVLIHPSIRKIIGVHKAYLLVGSTLYWLQEYI